MYFVYYSVDGVLRSSRFKDHASALAYAGRMGALDRDPWIERDYVDVYED